MNKDSLQGILLPRLGITGVFVDPHTVACEMSSVIFLCVSLFQFTMNGRLQLYEHWDLNQHEDTLEIHHQPGVPSQSMPNVVHCGLNRRMHAAAAGFLAQSPGICRHTPCLSEQLPSQE